MRNLLLALTMVFSTVAYAENWTVVTDSNSGTRLLADLDSVRFESYERALNEHSTRVYATMQYVNGEISDPFIAVIDVVDCMTKQNGLLINQYIGGKTHSYFWDVNSTKLYDAQGAWLCGFSIAAAEEFKKSQAKDKKKIRM